MGVFRVGNIVIGAIAMLVSGLFFYLTFSFPVSEFQDTGPGFLPRVYCIILFFLGITLILQYVPFKEFNQGTKNKSITKELKMALKAMGLVLLYLLVIPYLGFYIATLFIVVIFLWVCGVRQVLQMILLPLGLTLFVFILFNQMLNIPIPSGMLIENILG